jgi:hypothetical protein
VLRRYEDSLEGNLWKSLSGGEGEGFDGGQPPLPEGFEKGDESDDDEAGSCLVQAAALAARCISE